MRKPVHLLRGGLTALHGHICPLEVEGRSRT